MNRIITGKFTDFVLNRTKLLAIACVIATSIMSASARSAPNSGITQGVSVGAPAEPETEVKIDNFVFSPQSLTVKVGTQVTWVNKDDIPHTVDSTQGKFKSAPLDTDDKFQFRFTEPGEYAFYCRIHPKMTGKIIVQP